MDEWKSLSTEVVSFEKAGDSIEGKLIDVRDGNFFRPDGSKSKVYDIETATGVKTLFGSMILERLMRKVQVGRRVKIVYKGTVKTKSGRMAKSYEVYVSD